jgi:8-oxo-dGTP diphosphatase
MIERITRVAAYAVCLDEHGRMLLCRLAPGNDEPGSWTLPGGGVDFGEHPYETAVRELTEETGLTGRIIELIGIDSQVFRQARPTGDREAHAIRIVYRVAITGGELRDELDGSTDTCAWLSPDEQAVERLVELVAFAQGLSRPHVAPSG